MHWRPPRAITARRADHDWAAATTPRPRRGPPQNAECVADLCTEARGFDLQTRAPGPTWHLRHHRRSEPRFRNAASKRQPDRAVVPVVRWGSSAPPASGRLSAAADCAERTTRRSPAGMATRSTRLSQPWQRHSGSGAAARAEAIVARPGRARLDVGDCNSAPSLLGSRLPASTITSCAGMTLSTVAATSITELPLGQAQRLSHRCRHTRCSVSSDAEEISRPFETSAPAARPFAGRAGPGKRQRLHERASGRLAETVIGSVRLLDGTAGANDGRRAGCRFDYVSGRLCRREPATSGRRPTRQCRDRRAAPSQCPRKAAAPARGRLVVASGRLRSRVGHDRRRPRLRVCLG
jgi:hypothetical protein